jgi:sugar/nucleoside kinase (ribokinase family)
MSASSRRVVSLGVHLVDVIGYPVAGPLVSGSRHVTDRSIITAAGTAAGTSVDLAKLGCDVISMGAIGTDLIGDVLISLLQRHGVDTAHLTRKADYQTTLTIVAVRPDGDRELVMHTRGATPHLEAADIDLDVIAGADLLHVGGADVLGSFAGEPLARILRHAREHGVPTTMDLLTACDPATLERLTPSLAEIDHLIPNIGQVAGMTGIADPIAAASALRALGPSWVAVTCGADGSVLVGEDTVERLPALPVRLVDATGCGDAVNAGYIAGLLRGWAPSQAVWLGAAAASLVAGGLGSDAGIADFDSTADVVVQHAPPETSRLARIETGRAATSRTSDQYGLGR